MPIVKHRDWSSWWDGLRSKVIKAGAESIATNVSAYGVTNSLDSIPGLGDIGLSWKSSLVVMLIQFGLRVLYAASTYVAEKPDPDIVTEQIDTAIIAKKAEIATLKEVKESIKP